MVLGSDMTVECESEKAVSGSQTGTCRLHGRWSTSDLQVAPHLALSPCLSPVRVSHEMRFHVVQILILDE